MDTRAIAAALLCGTLLLSRVAAAQPAFPDAAYASDIIGRKVHAANGEEVGSVNDLLVNPDGRIEAAVIDVGGLAGVATHTVVIDWSKVKIDPAAGRVTLAMTKDQVQAAPEYKKAKRTLEPGSGQQTQQKRPGSSENQRTK